MTLKPDVKAFLRSPAGSLGFPIEGNHDQRIAWLATRRAPVRQAPDRESVGSEWEVTLREGLRVRVYVPECSGPHPVFVYLHGGGWVMGDLEMHDPTCRRLCNRAGCCVVNVDYRLAPEHPFPAALEDALAAVRWTRERAAEWDASPDMLAVGGSSAGGNLAAVVALRARDEGGPPIALQVLIYPITDFEMTTSSYRANGQGYFLDRPQMEFYWDQYVPDPLDRDDPYAAPLRAASLSGLPPAIVITAECDPLRDEGEAYAARIEREGGRADLVRHDGQIHGFMGMLGALEDAEPALDDLAGRVRNEFARLATPNGRRSPGPAA